MQRPIIQAAYWCEDGPEFGNASKTAVTKPATPTTYTAVGGGIVRSHALAEFERLHDTLRDHGRHAKPA